MKTSRPLLKHRPDPRLRSYLIHRFVPRAHGADSLIKQLAVEKDNSIRQGLILGLGEFPLVVRNSIGSFLRPSFRLRLPGTSGTVSNYDQDALIPELLRTYEHDPDPGVHGAAEWLLRMWQQDQNVQALNDKLKENAEQRLARQAKSSRGWFVNSQGQTFAVIAAPVKFTMGSAETEAEREDQEHQHQVELSYNFAVATKEVTLADFGRFAKEKLNNESSGQLA